MVRTDFIRGLSDSHLRKKIRKKCNPIEHTLTELIQYAIKYGKENNDVGLDSESDEDDPLGVRRNSYSATARMFTDRFGLGPAKKGVDRKASSSASTSRRSSQAQGGRGEEEVSIKEVAAQLVTVVVPLTEFVQALQRQRLAAAQRQQAAMAAGAPMIRPTVARAVPPLRCYNCNQPGHLAKDCPKPRTQGGPAGPSQIPLAAPTIAGQGTVATVMDTGATEMVTPAATEIGPDEYMAAAMFEPGTIGVIRQVQRITEESDLGSWRPGFEDLAAPSPEYKDGHIDVLDALKALDLRIPIPILYLLTISEAANEKLIERCLKNRRRFEESRKGKKPVLQDLPANEESQPLTSKLTEGPYPMHEFAEYLVELTDVEPLPFADEDAWELHRVLNKSVALGMFQFFVDHEDHCIGEHFVVYYVITRPKPAEKEGTMALYPFAQLQTIDPGLLELLELIHLELLSIAQVIASEEEEIQPRLRTATAPRRMYNAVVIPDYIAQRAERLEDFPEEKPLRPPSSYLRSAPPKAPKKTPKRKRRHPSPRTQGSRIGGGEEVIQPARTRNPDPVPGSAATPLKETVVPSPPFPRVPDLNLDGAGSSSAAAAGGGSRMGFPDPISRPPVLAGPLRSRQPPRGAPVIDISSSSEPDGPSDRGGLHGGARHHQARGHRGGATP
ncbi:hypothetical protein CBR_g48043 [Chara braunii]|uniref:CCHC-type domain-containing protein n=1 Tax=Chara braunii TaxID=69332 RepID=A0A388M1Y5_CHABU|nr:hypothetical protein CBR_g48043 [Chara braunii]|eukprot:GBG88574.1 hypothetical protein CBR_g48043 [Chara braunii]